MILSNDLQNNDIIQIKDAPIQSENQDNEEDYKE